MNKAARPKIIFMAKETESSKLALQYLIDTKVDIVRAVIRKTDYELKTICSINNIILCKEEDLLVDYRKGKLHVDYIISFYWKRVGCDILQIPNKGSINFHPGPLPEARGSGYHIAILENWGYWGVAAHFMDKEFDTGAIIECRRFPIEDEIINKDLVQIAHEQLFLLFKDIVNEISENKIISAELQEDGRYFSLKDLEERKQVCEKESIEEIDRKIRAFWNPPYNGAQIEIKGKKYTIINEEILNWIVKKINM